MKKLWIWLAVLAVAALWIAGCGNGEDVGPGELSGTITVWAFNDEFDDMIPMFEEAYPDIEVEFTKIPSDEIVPKLEAVLETGVGVPDVFVGEQAWVKRWIDMDVWENLSADPYNADELAKDHFEYVKDYVRDAEGNLRGLTWQATPGAVFYRRSLAEEAFGTDDPEEISALMKDMDSFIEMGRTLKEKTGAFLVPGVNDIQRLFFFNKKQPWVVDGKLVIEDIVLEYFDVAKTLRDEGLDGKIDMWTGEWFTGMNENVFSYVLPTWGLFFALEPNAEEVSGDWAAAHGPASYMWGGTWVGIAKASENKNLAWQFVKYITTDKEFLKQWALDSGDFVSDMAVVEEIVGDYSREFLGGQNHYAYFYEEAKRLGESGWAERVTGYDEDIQNSFLEALQEYVVGNKSKDEAIEYFKELVITQYPDITVE
jgi:ABC-type glycerol-3-phosphate transport system substrate-binding protein